MADKNNISVNSRPVGKLVGHNGMVTSIVTGESNDDDKKKYVISGSRDKKLIIWKLIPDQEDENSLFGEPYISLTGHNHFVSDLSLNKDCNYVLSSSWDKSMRLWSLKTGKCTQKFFGSAKEINSCAFSYDSRQIFSSGFDNKLALWNTKGEQKALSSEKNHQDCVTRIRFSPSAKVEFYASVGWDGRLKLWSKFFKCNVSFMASQDPLYALAISSNGAYIATGGKDCHVKIWKVQSFEKPQADYEADSIVNDVAFNPRFQWVAAACDKSVKIWDISNANTNKEVVCEDVPKGATYKFTSIAWDRDGEYLYVGCSDGIIRVFKIETSSN